MQREPLPDVPDDWRDRQPPTVLVVDDTPDNLALMAELLGERYRVKVANSGERALKAAQSEPVPDLVLLDIMMPGMDGLECLEILKKKHPKTAIIMITALKDEARIATAKRLGALQYIIKPFSLSYLESELLKLLPKN